MSRPGETITAVRSPPASRAARIGQVTKGRPQTGCSTLGSSERIRVPAPAAMTRTRVPLTRESYGQVTQNSGHRGPTAAHAEIDSARALDRAPIARTYERASLRAGRGKDDSAPDLN